LGRKLKVDYVENYKVPKYREDAEEELRRLWEEGCAPKPILLGKREEKESQRKHKMKSSKRRNVKKRSPDGTTKKIGRRTTSAKKFEHPLKKSPPRSKRSPVYNPRPDFRKADWRDIEIWRVIQNRDREAEELKKTQRAGLEPDAPFIPKRYR
ncbi:hypothetical protein OESDEN_22727, partial [Oesophagostomum dentatum]